MINHLVLDAGGILTTNLSPTFWKLIADELQYPQAEMYRQYKVEVSSKLWTGVIDTDQFWSWFEQFGKTITKEARHQIMTSSLLPLPSLQSIPQWSMSTAIHIMSNHRTEWLLPILNNYLPYVTSVHISDKIGLKKPDIRFYHHVQQSFKQHETILFVDDTASNLLAAQALGWQTVHGDESGDWTATVTRLLT